MPVKNTTSILLLFLERPKKLVEALPSSLIQMVYCVYYYICSVVHCLMIVYYDSYTGNYMILGREMVINVADNQLDPLLRATGHADGDSNCETGYSPYPGNINQVRSILYHLCFP